METEDRNLPIALIGGRPMAVTTKGVIALDVTSLDEASLKTLASLNARGSIVPVTADVGEDVIRLTSLNGKGRPIGVMEGADRTLHDQVRIARDRFERSPEAAAMITRAENEGGDAFAAMSERMSEVGLNTHDRLPFGSGTRVVDMSDVISVERESDTDGVRTLKKAVFVPKMGADPILRAVSMDTQRTADMHGRTVTTHDVEARSHRLEEGTFSEPRVKEERLKQTLELATRGDRLFVVDVTQGVLLASVEVSEVKGGLDGLDTATLTKAVDDRVGSAKAYLDIAGTVGDGPVMIGFPKYRTIDASSHPTIVADAVDKHVRTEDKRIARSGIIEQAQAIEGTDSAKAKGPERAEGWAARLKGMIGIGRD